MGVSGLWTLLEPVGKRVNIQALAGKTLAIDASIWIFQFLNTMRDAEGNFIRNGHLMGFFRRICRLLFNRIRPVFVFDGATPALKRLTVVARRRRRELQAAKVRKTAEKLLLKKLKVHLLEEEKASRAAAKARKAASAAEKKAEKEAAKANTQTKKRRKRAPTTVASDAQDESAPIDGATPKPDAPEPPGNTTAWQSTDTGAIAGLLIAAAAEAPVAVPGQKNGSSEGTGSSSAMLRRAREADASADAEIAAAAQATELAAAAAVLEDEVEVAAAVAWDGEPVGSEDESDGELDLDAIVTMGGELDPAAVGQLPPSLQLEVLTRHREQQATLNRARFQAASSNAEGFSALQMRSYIKQTELRRKMDAVRATSSRGAAACKAGSHFVLEDHASEAPGLLKVQVHSAGKGPSEWNRHVMNAAKKAPHGPHASGGAFVPPAELAGILPGMPRLVEARRVSIKEDEAIGEAPVLPAAEDVAEVTAEELAAALGGDGDGLLLDSTGAVDGEEEEEFDWEDARGYEEDAAAAAAGGADGDGPTGQPQRRDMWTRTHGYKFGRKLGDWSGADGGGGGPADVSPAVDPLEATVLEAAAAAAAADGADDAAPQQSVHEQRRLQHGILNSLRVQEGSADGDAPTGDDVATPTHAVGVVEAAGDPRRQGRGASRDSGAVGTHDEASGGAEEVEADGDGMMWEDAVHAGVREEVLAAHERRRSSGAGQPDAEPLLAAERASGGVRTPVGQPAGSGGAVAEEAMQRPRDAGPARSEQAAPAAAAAAVGGRLKMSMPKWGGHRGATRGLAGAGAQPAQSHESVLAAGAVVLRHAGDGENGQEHDISAAVPASEHASAPSALFAACPAPEAPSRPPTPAARNSGGAADTTDGSARAAPQSTPLATAARTPAALPPVAGAGQSEAGATAAALTAGVQADSASMSAGDADAADAIAAARPVDAGAEDGGTDVSHWGTLREDELGDVELGDEELTAVIAMAEGDAEVEAAAEEEEEGAAVVRMASAEGATADGATGDGEEWAGGGGSAPTAKVVAGTLDGFLPDSEAADLERRLRDVMGEVKGSKRSVRKQSGQDDVPTDMMYKECQELLQLFGIPYIIAPMEAEAQCAWLEENGLVDGVVTDDNDALLFGASHVFRHFFQEKQYCEQYLRADWERDLGLTKERLALLALLLGSDYTEGISGIGVVNAMETLAAFPSYDELKLFRAWLDSPDLESFRAVTDKKGQKQADKAAAAEEERARADVVQNYKASHRQACKVWEVPATFPDHKVLQAYATPSVDASRSAFTFMKPDLHILRGYCHKRFGWTQVSTDSLLIPVLAEYEKKESQMRLDAFYTMTHRFAKIKSKRLQAAVSTAMGRALPDEMVLGESIVAEAAADAGRKRKRKEPSADEGADEAAPSRLSHETGSQDDLLDSDADVQGEVVDKVAQEFFY
eukprot:jgi/Ulvmu1/7846/UM004_0076.1